MTTPEPPEPPLRELSAFVGATRPARSRKERIEMTTPEPSTLLTDEELDALLKLPGCGLGHAHGINCGVPVNAQLLDRLIAQARAARPSPWQPIETADPSADVIVSDGVDVGDGWFSKDTRRWRLQHKLGSRPVTHWMPKPSPPAQD